MQVLQHLLHDPMELIFPLGVFTAAMAAGYAVVRVLRRILASWAERSRSRPANIMSQSLHTPMILWALIFALHVAIQVSDLPERYGNWGAKTLLVLLILSLTIMSVRMAGSLIRFYGSAIPGALPLTTVTQNLVQLSLVVLGILVMLSQLGFSLLPILTALGAGGLAVALALQDTFANLFSGFYVAVAGQVRLGDYIKMNTGEEGYVTDIGWRSTTLRALSNNLVIVPNTKLAQAIVTNYSLPEKRIAVQVQVSAAYDSDPEMVEQMLLDVVRTAASEVPGILAEPQPSVTFDPGLGESGFGFSVGCYVAEFSTQFAARHELRKRIFVRFRAEGIHVPYPTRTLHVHAGTGAPHLTE
jgi:small-conductance mechanosensitive channel